MNNHLSRTPEQILRFLNISISSDKNIIFSEISNRTKSDYGFHVTSRDLQIKETYYLHTGKSYNGLSKGDQILCSVKASSLVKDRIDVDSYYTLDEIKKVIDAFIDERGFDTVVSLIQIKWVRRLIFGVGFLTFIKRFLDHNESEKISDICGKDLIVENIKSENQIEIIGLALKYRSIKAAELLNFAINETKLSQRNYLKLYELCVESTDYISTVLEIMEEGIRLEFLEKLPYKYFVDLHDKLSLDNETYYNYFLNHYVFDTSSNKVKIENSCISRNISVFVELIRCCNTWSNPKDNIIQYIAGNIEIDHLIEIFKCGNIKVKFITEALQQLLTRVIDAEIPLSAVVTDSFGQNFLALEKCYRNVFLKNCAIKDFELLLGDTSLLHYKGSTDIDFSIIWERIESLDKQNIKIFNNLSSKSKEALIDNVPLNTFIFSLKYFGHKEDNYCEYVIKEYMSETEENKCILQQNIIDKKFIQARLLVALSNAKHAVSQNKNDSASTLNLFIRYFNSELIKNLFEAHVNPLRKIDNYIFKPCVHEKKHDVCEGKIIQMKKDGNDVTSENGDKDKFIVWCRNRKCEKFIISAGEITEQLTYVLKNWFEIELIKLYESEQFTRGLAAINRWNEIIDSLTCRVCNEPLQYSEHKNNSMGKMAYGASYWHCSNRSCSNYSVSVKLTHCIGCGEPIDSRDNTVACNIEELYAFNKFYLCNSCGSCCHKHNWTGICPNCGELNAYDNYDDSFESYAKCKKCEHKIKLPKKFKSIFTSIIEENIERNEKEKSELPQPYNRGLVKYNKNNSYDDVTLDEYFELFCS